MPVTVIAALTERSSLTVTVPVPEAVVDTGGTSFAPESAICCPPMGDIDWQPTSIATAPIITRTATHPR